MSDRIVLEGEVSLSNVIDGEGVPFFPRKTQEKTVIPTNEDIIVTPDDGFTLSKVTVKAIEEE